MVFIALCVFVQTAASEEFYVVAEATAIRIGKDYHNGTPPLMEVEMVVREVLRGPQEVLGKTFGALARNYAHSGNTEVVEAPMKVGNQCICVVAYNKVPNPVLLFTALQRRQISPDAVIPVVKDYDKKYDRVLAELRYRRDHPEAYKDEAPKAPDVVPTPKVAPLNPVSLPEPPALKAPAPVPLEKEPLMSTEGWLTTGAALLLLVTLILKRRGVLK